MRNVLILCFANYCRSPVAEKILKDLFKNNIYFSSYGIQPKVDVCMDIRSKSFLEDINISDQEHFPRKINQKKIDNSNLVLCMDHFVLALMNKKFPRSTRKFKLFTFKEPEGKIEDPYTLDEHAYKKVMEKIEKTCKNFKSQDFDTI